MLASDRQLCTALLAQTLWILSVRGQKCISHGDLSMLGVYFRGHTQQWLVTSPSCLLGNLLPVMLRRTCDAGNKTQTSFMKRMYPSPLSHLSS